ncbi:MAG: hypothetical protein AB7O46_13465 [Xanthobacteraceae bacterium]
MFLKNENHIVWIDDKPRFMAPDLICVVNAKTGEPYTNTIQFSSPARTLL